MKIVRDCSNIFGYIDLQYAKKIEAFIQNPTFDSWDEAAHVIVKTPFTTLWNAINLIDPTFPHSGRAYDENDNVVREWERIPRPLQVLQAIKAVQS